MADNRSPSLLPSRVPQDDDGNDAGPEFDAVHWSPEVGRHSSAASGSGYAGATLLLGWLEAVLVNVWLAGLLF
jgi:hypothetical protein